MADVIQWQRDNPAGSKTGAVDIAGATGSSYTYTASDVGHSLRVRDSGDATVAVSSWSSIVTNPTPVLFGASLVSWIATTFGSPWTGEGHLPDSTGSVVSVTSNTTLQAALNAAVSGQIIELASGIYGPIVWQNKAYSASNPVTVRPASGASITLKTPLSNQTHAWYMNNVQGVKLVDLSFDLCNYGAIKLDTHVRDVEINGCTMTRYGQLNTGQAVLTDYECERIALWNCRTYNGGDHGLYLGSAGSPPGAAYGVKGLLVANHLSHDNGRGVGTASGASAGYGIQLGDSVWGARVVNATCDHNGLNSTASGGITFYTQGSVSGNRGQDVMFVNCIATNNNGNGMEQIGTSPNASTNSFTHCLASGNSPGPQFYNFTGSLAQLVAPNWTTGDPLYVDRTNSTLLSKDFRPSASGAAYNLGVAAWTPATDHAGTARQTPDLGAYASV